MVNMEINAKFIEAATALVEDSNGNHVYTYERALFGYLEVSKMMIMPKSLFDLFNEPPNLTVRTLGGIDSIDSFTGDNGANYRNNNPYVRMENGSNINIIKLTIANYAHLVANGMPTLNAYIVAALRARWCFLGCLYKTRADRAVTHNEIVMVEDDNELYAPFADITNISELANQIRLIHPTFMDHMTSGDYNLPWITNTAEAIWAISEYFFRVRGHHFKIEHIETIQKIYMANYEGNKTLPDSFPFADVFHTAIHPFGIKALPVMTYHFLAHGRLGNAMIVRLSGAPNGFAAITTSAAAVRMIAGEPWYADFARANSELITLCNNFAAQILDNKYAFHLSANLYGISAMRFINKGDQMIPISQADSEVAALAPALQGFIDFVKTQAGRDGVARFSFANAMSIQKRAHSNPMLSLRVTALIRFSINSINDSENVRDAILATFPTAGGTGVSG